MSARVGGWNDMKSQHKNLPQHCLVYHETRIKGPDDDLEDKVDGFANPARSSYISAMQYRIIDLAYERAQ
jgi:hypothetical protein